MGEARPAWLRRRPSRPLFREWRLLWLPPLVVLAIMAKPRALTLLIGAGIGLAVLVWAIRRPGRALVSLIVFLPFQLVGFSLLYRFHVPGSLLRPAGGLKEVLGVGILLAGVRAIQHGRSRLDALDKAALCYVAVATIHLLVPQLFVEGPQLAWKLRLLGWREETGYVLVFFGARHAPIAADTRRRVVIAVCGTAAVVAAGALYQWLEPARWLAWEVHTARIPDYMMKVLGGTPNAISQTLSWAHGKPVRVSSFMLSPFDMPDYLLLALGLAVERIARARRTRWPYLLGGALLGAIYASRTRADALAALLILVLALLPAPKRRTTARIRLIAGLCIGAAAIVPALAGSRYLGNQGGSASTSGHVREIQSGIHTLASHPLGLGIGHEPGIEDRFKVGGVLGQGTVDNSVLQVGDELGIQALLPWIIMILLAIRALGQAAKRSDDFPGGIRLAFLGLLLAGMYHHVFLTFAGPWTIWATIGLAVDRQSWQGETASSLAETHPASVDAMGDLKRMPMRSV